MFASYLSCVLEYERKTARPREVYSEGANTDMGITKLKSVPKYNQQVVEILEDLLGQAKAGEVVEVICTVKTENLKYDTYWSGCDNVLEYVGHLDRIKQLMLRRMD